jgi:hypothetical protein
MLPSSSETDGYKRLTRAAAHMKGSDVLLLGGAATLGYLYLKHREGTAPIGTSPLIEATNAALSAFNAGNYSAASFYEQEIAYLLPLRYSAEGGFNVFVPYTGSVWTTPLGFQVSNPTNWTNPIVGFGNIISGWLTGWFA